MKARRINKMFKPKPKAQLVPSTTHALAPFDQATVTLASQPSPTGFRPVLPVHRPTVPSKLPHLCAPSQIVEIPHTALAPEPLLKPPHLCAHTGVVSKLQSLEALLNKHIATRDSSVIDEDPLAYFCADPRLLDQPEIPSDEIWEAFLNNAMKSALGWSTEFSGASLVANSTGEGF